MISSLLASLSGLLGLAVAFFFVRGSAKKAGLEQGRKELQQELAKQANAANAITQAANEAVLQQVEQVHEIHDSLQRDADYAERVRNRFTRPD